ncbi:MAG: phospholipase D-like domain-containing protein [Candidatus Hodarchaeales archaeon]|jgi:phosphatidylserine/phosphatidylglycerophosphate/cardiolipin synthase-like enzyme
MCWKPSDLTEEVNCTSQYRAVLQQGKKAIHIGTDRIIRTAVGPVLTAAFNIALKKEVGVQVRWGRKDPRRLREGEITEYQQLVEEIRAITDNKIEIADTPSHSHAKFLTMDDHFAIVTSYNLLAFSGNGLANDEITAELGVVISSHRANKQIIESYQ